MEKKLQKGLEYSHLKEYDEFLMNFDEEKFKKLDRNEQKDFIKKFTDMLEELYSLPEKVVDQYLVEQNEVNFKKIFEKYDSVSMPVDLRIFYLERKYYKLIMKLYEFIEIK